MALHRELLRTYLRVLLRPREFFEETPAPSAIEGAFAVFFVALTTMAAVVVLGLFLSALFRQQGYPRAAAAIPGAILRMALFAVVGVAIVWVVSGAIMHFITSLGRGGDSFGRTLGVTGYGMLPSIVNTVVGVVLVYITLQSVDLQGGPEAVATQIGRLLESGGPLRGLVNWGFLAWQAAIWTVGLREVHDTSWVNAAIAAAVVALGLGFFG